MRITTTHCLAACSVALAACSACTAVVKGEITVDNAAFKVANCRSGQALGFSGIELHADDGRRIRMLAMADGTFQAALYPAAAEASDLGEMLGPCGVLVMKAQRSRINSITNLEGDATLLCEGNGHSITGKVAFENCH